MVDGKLGLSTELQVSLRKKLFMAPSKICVTMYDKVLESSRLHRSSKVIKLFIIQLTHNIQFTDTVTIIKYLKVLKRVSNHRGSIIRETCTVLG